MNKLNKNEKGFSAVELILIIAVIALIGGVGYFVYKNHHKTTTAITIVKKLPSVPAKPVTPTNPYTGWKKYTSSDDIYTISYPSNWISTPCVKGCNTDAPLDESLAPPNSKDGGVVTLFHQSTNLTPQQWFDKGYLMPDATVTKVSTSSIDGYPAYYAQDAEKDGSGVVGLYIITNSGQEVTIMIELGDNNSTDQGSNETSAQVVATAKEIAQSIVFHNGTQ